MSAERTLNYHLVPTNYLWSFPSCPQLVINASI